MGGLRNTHLDTPRRERMKWDEMKSCYVLSSCHVGVGGLWLSHLAMSEIRNSMKFAGTFSPPCCLVFVGQDRQSWVPGPLLIPFDSGLSTLSTHSKPLNQKDGPQCSVLFPTVLCCDMEHGAQMSVTLRCLLQQKHKRNFTAFSASYTASHCIRVSGCSASNQRPTNKAGNGKVLFRSVLGCDMERGAQISVYKGSFTAFSAISTEEGWQKQTTASEFPAVQQATNDRQKRLVTAWCCFSQFLVVTWLLYRWTWTMDDTLKSGDEICILFLKNSASAREFWSATSGCLCGIRFWQHDVWEILKVTWYPPWAHHQASPALYQRSGCMKHTLEYTPKGEDEMRWNEIMLCFVIMSCRRGWFMA